MDEKYAAWAARWRVPLGFALGIAYLIFSQPTPRFLVAGGTIALVGLLVRSFAAGYLDKNHSLATHGPYAFTRNPLYVGSFLMGAGFSLAVSSWALGVAFLVLFTLIYWPVMRREEFFLHQQFGETYARYAQTVPIFFPNLFAKRGLGPGEERFRCERYLKNREYEAALGYVLGMIFLAAKMALR